jgi:DinB family protein
MQVTDLEMLRYPVGRFERPTGPIDRAARVALIDTLEQTPARFRSLLSGRSSAELDTPYRPDGWTLRQVVHHVADSHMNAYIRMKWAMTEDTPAIKVYDEQLWAELPEARTGDVELSLALLEALHRRWVAFLRLLPDDAFRRAFVHPEWHEIAIEAALALYAWHGRHHAAHIEQGLGRQMAQVG